MLDGLLGRGGFSSKCKSLIKPTRARIEALRRRAEAKQRFLKEDLAKLLANGLDVNAYGRTEEFIAGLDLLSCYTFLDQSCEYILKQLSIMQKQGQCPEECRETVASLMFAAARFSDLPELRDLRDVFQERYGDGIECFVNQVFVEKLSSRPPVIEKRVKLLQDIASEFSIQWDSNGFKKRMDKPSASSPEAAFKKHGLEKNDTPLTIKNPGSSYHDRKPEAFENRGKKEKPLENEENGGRLFRGTHGFEMNDTPLNTKRLGRSGSSYLDKKPEVFENRERTEKHLENGDNDDRLFKGTSGFEKNNTPLNTKRSGSSGITYQDKRPEALDDDIVINRRRKEKHSYKHDPSTIWADTIVSQDNNDHLFRTISPRSSHDKRQEILGNHHVPTSLPDLFYHAKSDGVNGLANQQNDVKLTRKPHDEEAVNLKTCYNNSLPPPYVKSNIPPPYSKPKDNGSRPHDTIMDPSLPNHTPTENRHYQNEIPLPKPRSMRRKYSKSSSSHDDIGSLEDSRIVKRVSSSRRKERKGLQILFDDEHYHRDDEEKMMDKLLLHYSKKPSAYDIGKLKKKKSRSNNSSKSPHHRSKSKDEVTDDVDINIIAPPARSISLPHEQIVEMETKKVYARANSFQPDNQAKHVHPKLPDYDDLAARFAALRGR